MVQHEVACFEQFTGVTGIEVSNALEDSLGERELTADLLLFGGSGAYSVLDELPWVHHMLDFLVTVCERKVPSWASCFAFQGLARALGGTVIRDDERQELGSFPLHLTAAGHVDPLFRALPQTFHAQLGHHDLVERLPPGVTLLATGDLVENQAFKVDDAPFWGAQFHPELDKQRTLQRFNHYRKHYEMGEAGEDERRIAEGSDTPEVHRVLRGVVAWARERKG